MAVPPSSDYSNLPGYPDELQGSAGPSGVSNLPVNPNDVCPSQAPPAHQPNGAAEPESSDLQQQSQELISNLIQHISNSSNGSIYDVNVDKAISKISGLVPFISQIADGAGDIVLSREAKRLEGDLNLIGSLLSKLKALEDHLGGGMYKLLDEISAAKPRGARDKFRLLGEMVADLTLQIRSPLSSLSDMASQPVPALPYDSSVSTNLDRFTDLQTSLDPLDISLQSNPDEFPQLPVPLEPMNDLIQHISSSTWSDIYDVNIDSTISTLSGLLPFVSKIVDITEEPGDGELSKDALKVESDISHIKGMLGELKELEDQVGEEVHKLLGEIRTSHSQRAQDKFRLLGGRVADLTAHMQSSLSLLSPSDLMALPSRDGSSLPANPVSSNQQIFREPITDLIQHILSDSSDDANDVIAVISDLLPLVSKIVDTTDEHASIELYNEAEKLEGDLNHIRGALCKLKELGDHVGVGVKELIGGIRSSRAREAEDKFHLLCQMVSNLTLQIPPLPKMQFVDASVQNKPHDVTSFDTHNLLETPSGLDLDENVHVSAHDVFEDSLLREYLGFYSALSLQSKMCLFCFSVFPANAVVKKRLLVIGGSVRVLLTHQPLGRSPLTTS